MDHFKKEFGQVAMVLLVLLASLGLITYLMVSNTFSFKDKIFSLIFYRVPSKAFDSPAATMSAQKEPTQAWAQKWEQSTDLPKGWEKISYKCALNSTEGNLGLSCSDGFIVNNRKWDKNSTIIINGSFSAKAKGGQDAPYWTSIGLGAKNSGGDFINYAQIGAESRVFPLDKNLDSLVGTVKQASSENDLVLGSYVPGASQKFKLVYTKIQDTPMIFYYIGDSFEPVQKIPLQIDQNPSLFLACKSQNGAANDEAECGFGDVYVSGIPAN